MKESDVKKQNKITWCLLFRFVSKYPNHRNFIYLIFALFYGISNLYTVSSIRSTISETDDKFKQYINSASNVQCLENLADCHVVGLNVLTFLETYLSLLQKQL